MKPGKWIEGATVEQIERVCVVAGWERPETRKRPARMTTEPSPPSHKRWKREPAVVAVPVIDIEWLKEGPEGMRQSAKVAFPTFSGEFEGVCYHMYLDVSKPRGLVTTGIGILLPKSLAVTFRWHHADGSIATREEVEAGWDKIDSLQAYKLWGGNHAVFRNACDLRLDDAEMARVFAQHLASDEVHLRRYFPNYDDACADAQLALHSMAWANGAAFSPNYPNFTKAFLAGDFLACVDHCWICHKYVPTLDANGKRQYDASKKLIIHRDENARPEDTVPDPDNTGVHPRNLANVKLLRNAAYVHANGLDRDRLYYPANAAEVAPTEPPSIEPFPTHEIFPGAGPTILEGEPPKDE